MKAINHTIPTAIESINKDLQQRGYTELGAEQVAAMQDRHCAREAIAMLDELNNRVRGISDETRMLALGAVLANTKLETEQRAFVEARIVQAVNEVGARMVAQQPFYLDGPAPSRALRDFADLHDYCDANTLGGLCEEALTAEANRLFPARSDPETIHTQEWMVVSGHIQVAVGEWLAGAGIELRTDEWVDRKAMIGAHRTEFPSFGELDVQLPVGWWDTSNRNEPCPSFRMGLYTLWIDFRDPDLSELRAETPRFSLELRDELGNHVLPVYQSQDWTLMLACLLTLPPSLDYLAMHKGHRLHTERAL